jgi:hypothetical protein
VGTKRALDPKNRMNYTVARQQRRSIQLSFRFIS